MKIKKRYKKIFEKIDNYFWLKIISNHYGYNFSNLISLLRRSSNKNDIFIYEDCLLCLISKYKKQYEFKYHFLNQDVYYLTYPYIIKKDKNL